MIPTNNVEFLINKVRIIEGKRYKNLNFEFLITKISKGVIKIA
jgi:hypothetical protein